MSKAGEAARNAYFGAGRHGPIEFSSLTPESRARWTRVAEAVNLDDLTDEQRLAVLSRYCRYCGSKNPDCQCGNDE